MFGPAIDPGNQKGLDAMDKHFSNIGYGKGRYSPVYRSGGVFGAVHQAIGEWKGKNFGGISLGRNLLVYDNNSAHSIYHESVHYYQQIYMGFDRFYQQYLSEAWAGKTYSTPYTLDNNADRWARYYKENY
jgi:hypothetical protein